MSRRGLPLNRALAQSGSVSARSSISISTPFSVDNAAERTASPSPSVVSGVSATVDIETETGLALVDPDIMDTQKLYQVRV